MEIWARENESDDVYCAACEKLVTADFILGAFAYCKKHFEIAVKEEESKGNVVKEMQTVCGNPDEGFRTMVEVKKVE